MMRKLAISAMFATLCSTGAAAQGRSDQAGDDLSRTINAAMEAEGPWLLPQERALIARKCGYTAEEAASDSINMSNGVLICSNGRRVDDAETRAMVEVASARISRRVHAVMDSPAVQRAIAAVSDEAVREAMQSLRELNPRRRSRR